MMVLNEQLRAPGDVTVHDNIYKTFATLTCSLSTAPSPNMLPLFTWSIQEEEMVIATVKMILFKRNSNLIQANKSDNNDKITSVYPQVACHP